ncbi:MAG: proton-conducting transporter membrane subunit [candidate division WOR-3 bacterium]
MMYERFVPLFVVLPLAGAFLIPLLSRVWKGFADLIGNLVGALLVGLSVYGLVLLSSGAPGLVYRMGNWPQQFGIVLVYDSLTALVVLVANLVGFPALLFSLRYLDQFTGRWKYYTLFMLMLVGMNGVAISGDMFNMFVFIEISAISSYALVAFGTGAGETEAGFKYMVMAEIGSLVILFSIALLYARASTLNMADMSRVLESLTRTPFYWFVLATMLVGFAIKMAMVPFHSWMPDAYLSAPAPVAAVLAGVFSKVVGVYAMSRVVFNVFGLNRINAPGLFNMLVGFGIVSIIVGALLALNQSNYKRLLAYSSIGQVGYILLGLGIGNYWGVVGALFHVLSHALAKGLLFLASRSIELQTGTRDINKLSGLEKAMPVTTWSYIVGALSLAGVPPFAGFFSKLFIILGAVAAKLYWMAVLAALFSVVTLGYLLKVINRMFHQPGTVATEPVRESPRLILLALFILVGLAIAFGVGFKPILDWVVAPAASVLFHGLGYAKLVLGG